MKETTMTDLFTRTMEWLKEKGFPAEPETLMLFHGAGSHSATVMFKETVDELPTVDGTSWTPVKRDRLVMTARDDDLWLSIHAAAPEEVPA